MCMPYGLLSCDVLKYVVALYLQFYCSILVFLTAIVFVVHAYPLRFVFLVVVGMGSVIVLRLDCPTYISERHSPTHTPR